jgi:hypothetical protein
LSAARVVHSSRCVPDLSRTNKSECDHVWQLGSCEKSSTITQKRSKSFQTARLAGTERLERSLKPTHEHGGWIEYLMTLNGPEPLAFVNSAIDYDFYMGRQLVPIA